MKQFILLSFLVYVSLVSVEAKANGSCDPQLDPLEAWASPSPDLDLEYLCDYFPNDPLKIEYSVWIIPCGPPPADVETYWLTETEINASNYPLQQVSSTDYKSADFSVHVLSAGKVILTRLSDNAAVDCPYAP